MYNIGGGGVKRMLLFCFDKFRSMWGSWRKMEMEKMTKMAAFHTPNTTWIIIITTIIFFLNNLSLYSKKKPKAKQSHKFVFSCPPQKIYASLARTVFPSFLGM